MTSFVFRKTFLCFRVRVKDDVRVRVRVRVIGNTFKNIFGQALI